MTNSLTKSDFVINDTIKRRLTGWKMPLLVKWMINGKESEKKQKISEKYFQIRVEKALLNNHYYSKSKPCNSGSEPENEKNWIFYEKNIQVLKPKITKEIAMNGRIF